MFRPTPALAAILILAACGGTSPDEYEDLSGSLAGTIEGTGTGVTLSGNLSLTVTQTGGELTGTSAIDATINLAGTEISWNGSVPFTGTVAAGSDPGVTLAITDAEGCPDNTFSGTFTSSTKELTVTGTLSLYGDQCTPVASIAATVKVKK